MENQETYKSNEKAAKTVVKVAKKTSTTKSTVIDKPTPKAKVVAPKINKPTQILKPNVAPKVEAPKATKEKSTLEKVIAAGKTTGKIVTKAGGKILGSSIQTSKNIAGMYSKAGKKALEIGKDLFSETTKAVASNQKTITDTTKKAFKETVETIKETHLIENPLNGILKNKKK